MTSQWQFQPIFGSYLLAAALAVAMLLLLAVRPSFAPMPASRRRWLVVLRACLILLMFSAMLRPTRITTKRRPQSAHVLILFDASRSMQVKDAEQGRSRWQAQVDTLRRAFTVASNMGENFQVEWLAFDQRLRPQNPPSDATDFQIQARPKGEETDIGRALAEAIQRHVGRRLAAVILLSDGAQRTLSSAAPPQQSARQLDRRAAALYTIAFGQSRDQSQSRDVAIENLQDQYSVFVKNEFALRVGVRVQGFVNQPIPVRVEVLDQSRQVVETLGPVEVVATRDPQIVMADFAYRPERAGQYQLRVSAADQGEMVTDNNQLTAFLNVREGGLRVLLLTSALLDEEQKFIRWSLDESAEIELDFQPLNVLARRKLDLQAKLPLEQYDVFLIGGVDVDALRQDDWRRIADLVASGRGLMMHGGQYSFGPGGFADSPLADVLPVKMNRLERQTFDPLAPPRPDMHIEGPISMLPTTDSSITHLARDERNLETWKTLKPLWRANRLGALEDQAEVLAESPQGDPLLVQGNYVEGRVLALATDSTHRWYRHGDQEAHRKFWRQAILWLARRDKKQASDVWIALPQRRFRAESRIVFQTGLTDEAGDPVLDANLEATLTSMSDGSTETIGLSSDGEGARGVITSAADEPGLYQLTVRALEDSQEIASSRADFVVLKRDFELSDPAADPGLLDQLARITKRVGGKAIAPEQLPGVLEQIRANPPRDEIETQSKWQLGDTSWDAWSLFLLVVVLLGTEWFLRKKWGLV